MKATPVYLTLAVCVLSMTGGCPQNGGDDSARPITEISPSNIPPGIYSGEVVVNIAEYCGGEFIGSESSTTNISVSFNEAGIPLNYVSGEPERPGLSATEQYGALTVSQTTESVTIDGDRVIVRYRNTLEMEVPGYDALTLSGPSEDTYTVAGPGCISVYTTVTSVSEPLEDIGYCHLTLTAEGLLCLASASGDADEGKQSPAAEQLTCPYTLDDDPGYTVTIPCGSLRAEPSAEIPNSTFECYLFDDEWQHVYIVASVPWAAMLQAANPTAQFGVAFRYDGIMRSSTGDVLVLATGRLSTGALVSYAYGALSDNRLLMLGTEVSNPYSASFFGSVDMADTNGDVLLSPPPGAFLSLAAPVPDGIVLLSDNNVYRVGGADVARITSWQPGASILVHEASPAFTYKPFFVLNTAQWISVPADYVAVAELSSITSIETPEYSAPKIHLANGGSWRVAYSDEARIAAWAVGSPVAVFDDEASFLGQTMLHLPTGRAVVVEAW